MFGLLDNKLQAEQEEMFERYSVAQGLAHTHVLCTLTDSQGILWIGTFGGLNYFDGYTFHVYKTDNSDSTSISNPSVNVLFEDMEGYLWVGTENGLNRFDKRTGSFKRFWHSIQNTSTISNNTIKAIWQDKNNYLWLGTYGGGLNKYDPKTGTFIRYDSEILGIANDNFNRINTLVQDNDSILFVGTEQGGIYLFNIKTGRIEDNYDLKLVAGLRNKVVNAILKDEDNIVWIGTWNEGLFRYNSNDQSFNSIKELSPDLSKNVKINVRSIIEDSDKNLWLGLFGEGLIRYNKTIGQGKRYIYQKNSNKGVTNNFVWNLSYDKNEILWISTFGGGLNKFMLHQYRIKLYQIPEKYLIKPDNGSIKSICQDHIGKIFLGTSNSGLFSYDIKTSNYSLIRFSDDSITRNVWSLDEDKEGCLWVGASNRLLKIDTSRRYYSPYYNISKIYSSLNAGFVYHITQDTKGNICLGTWNGGLIILPYQYLKIENPAATDYLKFQHNELDSASISNNTVYTVFEDSTGSYWIGTSLYLHKMDPSTHKLSVVLRSVVGSVIQDKSGNIWAGSIGDGLFEFDLYGRIIDHFDIGDGLPSNTILGMVEDNNGMIWVSTNNGMSVFNKNQKSFSNFSLTDELSGNNYNLNSIIKLSSGAIAAGGISGFNVFWPDSLKIHNTFPLVIFTDFKIYNKSIVRENSSMSDARIKVPPFEIKKLSLSYKDKLLIIEFAALEYYKAKKINYAYRLQGFDKHWITTSSDHRYAYYSNLQPGKFVFEVKSTNAQGIWNNNSLTLLITIKPPFWKTIWFRFIIGLIVLLSGILIIQFRLKSYKHQQNILEQLVKSKTAEIIEQNKILEAKNIELNRQKEEILTQKDAIIEMTRIISEADEKKLNFFTNISNEFRTPLTLILGPVEYILDNLLSIDDLKDHLKVVYRNSLRLLRLTNDLLDFRQIDTKSLKIIKTNGNIIGFVKDIVDAFNDYANERKVNLHFNSNVTLYNTWFDSSKLEIVFYNLISNAIKFTSHDGNVWIRIVVDEESKLSEFTIEDDGIGIEEKRIDHLFKKFYEKEPFYNTSKTGYGIGLSLTKETIDLLKGEIHVKSMVGRGTKFDVILPLESEPDPVLDDNIIFNFDNTPQISPGLISQYITEPLTDNVARMDEKTETSDQPQKILIVEDDPDLRYYIGTCLPENYSVFEASDGKAGIKMAKEIQPNLIITDIMMPEMDGIEFCRKIKADFITSHIPVIILTALSSLEIQLEGMETGADAFIVKPFNKRYLITCIRSTIASREKLRKAFLIKLDIEPKEITSTSLDEVFLQKAKDIVEKNIDDPDFGVSELISAIGMSRTLVHMKLTELISCSTGEFIKQIRLKRACQLLKQRSHRISDVCYMVGFSSPHHFSKLFKKYTGYTPTEYAEKDRD